MSRFFVVILFSLVATLRVEAFVTFHQGLINPVHPIELSYVPYPTLQELDTDFRQTRFDGWDLLSMMIASLRPSPSSTTTSTITESPKSP